MANRIIARFSAHRIIIQNDRDTIITLFFQEEIFHYFSPQSMKFSRHEIVSTCSSYVQKPLVGSRHLPNHSVPLSVEIPSAVIQQVENIASCQWRSKMLASLRMWSHGPHLLVSCPVPSLRELILVQSQRIGSGQT